MCGIAGIISPNKNSTISAHDMCQTLRHRGPDDYGLFVDFAQGVYIGHRRLAVIDLSARAKQPFFNEDDSVVAAVNGEIYNFRQLKSELISRGHQFYSDSDSEVVVHAYEEWQEDFVKHLRGMFAIAIWDKRLSKLVLARDAIGIKPLYYLRTKEILAFASEIKAFLQIDRDLFTPQINRGAIETLLIFPFIPDDKTTMLEGVSKLPPGHILVWQDGETAIKKYWELNSPSAVKLVTFAQACENFEEKITDVVKSHLYSDVKTGVFLSGGVDSSLIAALAAKLSKEPINTFTIIFNHPKDENYYAKQVADYIGAKHHLFSFSTKDIQEKLEEIIWHFDDLSCVDGGLISLYFLAQKAKEAGIKVALNGEGADEIFGGYPWFALAATPLNFLPERLRNTLYYRRISKNIRSTNGADILYNLIKSFNEKDIFRQISKFEVRYQLPNSFLMKVDKGTMAHGVETRVPYLDREIVEFAYSLPASFKQRGFFAGANKVLLRAVAERYLPTGIAGRKKRGFLLPISQILKENNEEIRGRLLKNGSFTREILSKAELESLFNVNTALPFVFRVPKETLLWKLFIIEIWRERFIQEKNLKNSSFELAQSAKFSQKP